MRITFQMQHNMINSSLLKTSEELARKYAQLASGKKISKPSEDVLSTVRAMDLRVTISDNKQFRNNIEQANIQLSYTDKVMTSIDDGLRKMNSLLILDGNDLDAEEKAYYSLQAAAWRDFFLNISNTKMSERHIFSGFRTDLQAFTYNAATFKYDYNGDLGSMNVPVGKGIAVPVNVPGSSVFSPSLPQDLPAALPDTTPVAYAQATDPLNGVNTITITIGAVGDPDYDTFEVSNYMEMADVISFAWQGQGVDGLPLAADPAIAETIGLHRVQALAPVFDNASLQIGQIQTEIGIRQVQLDDMAQRLIRADLSLENSLARIEDADINETAVDIKTAETALDAMRTTAAKIFSQSLFDFLQ